MKKIFLTSLLLSSTLAFASPYYGPSLCAYPQFECVKVSSGQSWEKLFPDPRERDIVQRVNRSYNSLWPGKIIAVPRNLNTITLLDVAPFPQKITDVGNKQVIVDQDKLAWGAYDADGHLVNWGPISSGRDRCSDSPRSCRTMTGIFYFFSKESQSCRSNVYPIGKGGAKMPYCMYFHKGFALHGSTDVPGQRASHGCVRLFTQDAKWLNQEFVETSNDTNNQKGTKIIIRPVLQSEKSA
ncbi:MAG: L,D-transpeptidase [Legionellaceae bacterium]|nr:L,D-transpeptidase [Legionellaceae bacterium]